MKLVYFTDPHLMGVNPKSRKDFFPETILKELEEVYSIALEVGAKVVLCGGDWFNSPNPSYSVARSLAQILSTYQQKNIETISIIGNHEEIGYNPDTIEMCSIGVIEGGGLIRRARPHSPIYLEEDGVTVGITGCDAVYDLDRGSIQHYMPNRADADYHIHIVHGFLTKHKWMEEIPHTTIDQIEETSADIVLSGHEHSGFGVVHQNGKIFCNPGALARISASIGEMNRMPQVAIIDLTSKNASIVLRQIQCSLPSEEILDRESLEQEIESQKKIQGFINNLTLFSLENLSIQHVVERIANEDGLSAAVRREAKEQLQKAEEEIASEMNRELEERPNG